MAKSSRASTWRIVCCFSCCLHHVPNEPLATIHPPPLQSPPLKEYYHRVQVGVAMARDADSIQH